MRSSITKRMLAICLSIAIMLTFVSLPAAAEIPFPSMAEIANTKNGTTDIYSLPGTTGHEADKGTTSKKLDTLKDGTIVQITGAGIDGDGDKWYEINYGDGFKKTGFVFNTRIKVLGNYILDPEFEDWMTEQNFPESYKDALRNMHSLYPKWKFYADHTNLDFNASVKAENGGVNNKYIHVNSNISWKLYEKGEYNWETGKWKGYDGDSWIKTTDQVVAYYLDPRNFLDIKNVFMFADESFKEDKEDLAFVQNAVKGTFMDAVLPEYAVKPTEETTSDTTDTSEQPEAPKTYAHAILEAAKKSGVSTATIVAVIRQEQGTKGEGKLISGTYTSTKYPTELKGYYNFFNIGAYADGAEYPSAADRGLWWARGMKSGATTYGRPWNTREKSIIGGALWYGGNYVSVGQNTIYYKNFNVYHNTEHAVYKHQYATNIEDSKGKGTIMAQAMDFLTSDEIIFHIPVYKNMPEKTTLPVPGTNNNRFLETLSVEGYELSTSFDRYTYSYETIVPYSTSKVKLVAKASATDATVTGTGEVTLAVGNNDFNITVTSSTGLTATYKVSVHREKAPAGEAAMPELNTEYKIGDYMTNVQPETSIATFKTKLGVTNGKAVVMDTLGNEKKDGLIATGDTVHLYDANEKIRASYKVVIYGDIDGNGKITSVDLLVGQRHILKKKTLTDIFVTAMDTDHNSKVNSVDLLVGQRHILKIKQIVQ